VYPQSPQDIKDVQTRYQVFLQVKKDVLQGRWEYHMDYCLLNLGTSSACFLLLGYGAANSILLISWLY
jgi:hypothetical protein